MIKFFVTNRFTSIIVIGLLFMLLALFMYTHTYMDDQRMGTYFLNLWRFYPHVVFPVMCLCLLASMWLILRISNKYNIVKTFSFISVIFYLLGMLFMRTEDAFVWVMISQVLSLVLLLLLFRLNTDNDSFSIFFYGGLILSFMIMIYPPSMLTVAGFLLAANVNQSITFRHAMFFILGLLLPFIYLVSLLYLTGSFSLWYNGLSDFHFSERNYDLSTLIIFSFYACFLFVYLASLSNFTSNYNWKDQQNRLILLFMSLGILLSTFFSVNSQKGIIMLNAPMLGLMMTSYYTQEKPNRFALTLLGIFVILSFAIYLI